MKKLLVLPFLAALFGVSGVVHAAPVAACTAYCEASAAMPGGSAQRCYLMGENSTPEMQTKYCAPVKGRELPASLPENLQAELIAGKVANPFREQYPIPADERSPSFDKATVASLMALPLQLDGDDVSDEWLVYTPNPSEGEPPYFWVMQYQKGGKYQILLEHSGQMVWVSPESLGGYQTLRSARFAELDASGKTGTFTDLRDWQYTSGIYSFSKSEEMAAGSVDKPEPM